MSELAYSLHNTPNGVQWQSVSIAGLASGGGVTDLVAAVAGKQIAVVQLLLSPSATANGVAIRDGATAITGEMTVGPAVPFLLPFSRIPWLETTAGAALRLFNNSGTTINVGGVIAYVLRG